MGVGVITRELYLIKFEIPKLQTLTVEGVKMISSLFHPHTHSHPEMKGPNLSGK